MTELGHAIIVCPLFPGTRVDSMKVCPGKKMEAASDRFVWLDYLLCCQMSSTVLIDNCSTARKLFRPWCQLFAQLRLDCGTRDQPKRPLRVLRRVKAPFEGFMVLGLRLKGLFRWRYAWLVFGVKVFELAVPFPEIGFALAV